MFCMTCQVIFFLEILLAKFTLPIGNITVRAMDVDEKGMLTLGSKHGILKGLYTRGEVVYCNEPFITEQSVPQTVLSVRELARLESNRTGHGFLNEMALAKYTLPRRQSTLCLIYKAKSTLPKIMKAKCTLPQKCTLPATYIYRWKVVMVFVT